MIVVMPTKSSSRKANRERFDTRPGRTIVVNNVRWKWFIGRMCGTIVAYSENGDKVLSPSWKIDNTNPSDGVTFPVTPRNVENWLSTVKI